MTHPRNIFILLITIFTVTATCLAQGTSHQVTTSDPPKLETGRYGNPTSTARAYQHFKLGTVTEISKDELAIDKTPYGEHQWFKITPKTKFLQDGQVSDVSQLKAGENIFIDVKPNKKTGELVLITVAWGVVGKNMKGEGSKQ
jgi:hypothetical protein